MDGYCFSSFCIIGFVGLFFNLIKKESSIVTFLSFSLFVITAVSRIEGAFSYSDLTAYITRYYYDDNSYFGNGYKFLVNVIKLLFGYSVEWYVACIAILILTCVIISIRIWDNNKNLYYSTFILVFCIYWGLSFSVEVIRTGIAISLSLVSLACAKRRKIIYSILFVAMSIYMHNTQIFFIPIVLYMYYSSFNKEITYQYYILFLVALTFIDISGISIYLFSVFKSLLGTVISFIFVEAEHYTFYIDAPLLLAFRERISLQYAFYRLLGLALLYMYLKTNTSIVALRSYFFGLFVYSLMISFTAVTRMQWIFSVPYIFIVYDYIKYSSDSRGNKLFVLLMILIPQIVMSMNYLGVRW